METSARLAWRMGLLGASLGALGMALFTGGWYFGAQSQPAPRFPAELKAISGYGTETFAMVTGPIDGETEGLFTLDYLTGELQCWVLNPRFGKWGARFKRNVAADLGVEANKKPSFVLTTGMASFPATLGNQGVKPSKCAVYVADANTGKFASYYVPLITGAMANNALQWGELKPLDIGNARSVEVRE